MSHCKFFEGKSLEGLRIFGQVVDVWVRTHREEVMRREHLAVGAITNNDVIRALMTIPEGVPVEFHALESLAAAVLDEMLDAHAIDLVDGAAVRRAVPPVELTGFSKQVAHWSDVQAITLLRTHGPRIVVAPRALARRAIREIDSDVGVAVPLADTSYELMRPPASRAVRPSWQRWAIAEVAYSAWIRSQTTPKH